MPIARVIARGIPSGSARQQSQPRIAGSWAASSGCSAVTAGRAGGAPPDGGARAL